MDPLVVVAIVLGPSLVVFLGGVTLAIGRTLASMTRQRQPRPSTRSVGYPG